MWDCQSTTKETYQSMLRKEEKSNLKNTQNKTKMTEESYQSMLTKKENLKLRSMKKETETTRQKLTRTDWKLNLDCQKIVFSTRVFEQSFHI